MIAQWPEQAARLFDTIAALSRDAQEGITRESYGPGE